MDETKLIQYACQGDLDSFNKLVLEYQDLVFQRAYWIMREVESANDAAQDAFIKAYRNLSGFKNGSFRAWILRIVTNICYDELRRRKRDQSISFFHRDAQGEEIDLLDYLFDPAPSIEQTFEDLELLADVIDHINELPAEFRETLILVDILDLTYEEAALVLEVPMGTVKSRLARARLRIRKLIEPTQDKTSKSHQPISMSIGLQ